MLKKKIKFLAYILICQTVSCKKEYHDILNIEIAACSFSLCTMALNLGWPYFLPNSLKVFTIQLIYKLQQPLLRASS